VKKIFYHSDSTLSKTGFGRHAKALLSYLYQTGKYEIVNYCCGHNYSSPVLKKTPWKSIGVLPDSKQEIERLNKDKKTAKSASYGSYLLDAAIKAEKPDVYIGVQDIWGLEYAIDKPWFNKINSVIWTTLDSLPILPAAQKRATQIKNYWIWSEFATKALHKLGHKHVKTVQGCLDTSKFCRLSEEKRKFIRQKNNIPLDSFIVGFVFRNQLRKSVPNLLEGFQKFKKKYPSAKLLLHTSWAEGWNINKLAKEYKVDPKDIYTTLVCKSCSSYTVKNFEKQEEDCQICGTQKSVITTCTGAGVSEKSLNEIYNLMDVYCHPFTSGGQEIPIQEAKLTELITLVTNYSCGEDQCEKGSESIPLSWNSYREHHTEFIKANTCPNSIFKNLEKVYKMNPSQKRKMGKKAREWVLNKFSVEVIGKKLEQFLDSCVNTNYDFEDKKKEKEVRNFPDAFVPDKEDSQEWITSLYKKILNREIDIEDNGYKHWESQISKGAKREEVEKYFRKVATEHNDKYFPIKVTDLVDKEDKGKRILYILPSPNRDVFMATSLLKSIKQKYPDHNLYFCTEKENFPVLYGNEYIHKVIPYSKSFDNVLALEGANQKEACFDIVFAPYLATKNNNYIHNMKDVVDKDYLCTF